jgi:hypothetical protein
VLEAPVEPPPPKLNDIVMCCRDQSEPASLGLGEKGTEEMDRRPAREAGGSCKMGHRSKKCDAILLLGEMDWKATREW